MRVSTFDGLDTTSRPLHLLVVDDEPAFGTSLRTNGYHVTGVADGNSALHALQNDRKADVVLLDLGVRERGVFDVIKKIRASGLSLPIIVLSNLCDEDTKVTALELGADDYLTKPFGMRELLARINVSLRHRSYLEPARQILRSGSVTVDLIGHVVTLEGRELELSPTEYALLSLLIRNAGEVVPNSSILEEVWEGDNRKLHYIRIYIRFLRQKFGEDRGQPRYILTERGIGYRFCDPNHEGMDTRQAEPSTLTNGSLHV
jgi:two-component system, OmpR family, KDP operon response regulator KdpE